jgi:enoyl-CoA hydratase/carnithine racemase
MLTGTRLTLTAEGDGIAVLSFHNPPRGFMDAVTETELEAALDEIERTEGLGVVILTGAQEGVFIRHYDVRVLEERARKMQARGLTFATERPVPESPIHRCLRRIEASACIFIAALNGTAMGGGYELALACDLRIAQAGDYRIGLPESNVGLLPGAGGTQRLPALVGPARALEYLLLGRTFTPEEAAAAGLVNECCPRPALERALEIARVLAVKQPRALAHIKRLVPRADLARLAEERTLFCDLMVDPRSIDLMAQMNAGERTIDADARGSHQLFLDPTSRTETR